MLLSQHINKRSSPNQASSLNLRRLKIMHKHLQEPRHSKASGPDKSVQAHQQTDDFSIAGTKMRHSLRQSAPRQGTLLQAVRHVPASSRGSTYFSSNMRWMRWRADAAPIKLLQEDN